MGLRALIVDRSAVIRSVIKKVLVIMGTDPSGRLEAADGPQALKMWAKEQVDVIFADMHVPMTDGMAFLLRLDEQEILETIPVILVMAEARQEAVQRALTLGVKAHVRKPFCPEAIRAVLRQVLGDSDGNRAVQGLDGCDF
ncbi:MAG: response regulator [Thermodesulfobacteriota bacterium]